MDKNMNRERWEEICRAFLKETMEYNDLPGLAVGVLRDGEVWTGASGVRDVTTKDPLRSEDIFHCASVSKIFTAMSVLMLADRGILSPDDRLLDHLPGFVPADDRWREVRIRQMLSHTSGIGDVEDYHWEEAKTGRNALRDFVWSGEVRDLPLLWAPGEGGFSYSNIAYEILGHLLSLKSPAVTGGEELSYEDFVKSFLMRPAGMTDSTMKTFARFGVAEDEECPLLTDAIRRNNEAYADAKARAGEGSIPEEDSSWKPMALPHEKAEDRSIVPVKYYPYTRSHGPSSTLTSTVSDLLKWAKVLMADMGEDDGADPSVGSGEGSGEKPLLSARLWSEALGEHAQVPNNGERMGLGFFMREQCGARLYGHEGTDDGFRASFWICPEHRMATVVLSNLSKAPVKKINKKLFSRLMGE